MAELPKRPKDKRNLAERLRPKPKRKPVSRTGGKPVSRTGGIGRTMSDRDVGIIVKALRKQMVDVINDRINKSTANAMKKTSPVAKSRLTEAGKKLVKDKKQTGGTVMKKKMMGGGKTSKNMAKMARGGKKSKYMAKGGKTSKYMSKMARGGKKTKYMAKGGRR